MANKTMDSAREFETQAKELLERVKRMQNDLGAALQSVKRAESELIDKEKRAEKERMEKERAERLREVLTSEGDLAFHVGDDRAEEQPAPAESKSEVNEKPKPEPMKEQKAEESVQAKAEEPAMADRKPEEKPETKAKPAPANKPVQQQRPAYERREPQRREDGRQQKPRIDRPQRPADRPERTDRPQQRPVQGGYQPKPAARTMESAAPSVRDQGKNRSQKPQTRDEERKAPKNKKTIMKENTRAAGSWDDDAPMSRKQKRKQQALHKPEPVKIDKAVLTTETITVKDLSEKIGKPVAEIIKKLFILGIMATINQEIDYDTCSLIAADYGIELELNIAKTAEDVLNESVEEADSEENLVPRPPVVTIMGHVDHGKTSLLDAFRESSITAGEAGGITQHIGAYTVSCKGRTITFIDTPGHEAFTSMRARGAQVTDIVILVVAADDGIMPQTIESINHAKAANVKLIVAINKMDKPTANPERVKEQLTKYEIVPEDWGGDVACIPVSAVTGMGISDLLERIALEAEVMELRANPNRRGKGAVVEARLDKGQGPIATLLVQNGTLHKGDCLIAGTAVGRVRTMRDDKGREITEAGPSTPVEITGLTEVPEAGELFEAVEDERLARELADKRTAEAKEKQFAAYTKVTLDNLFDQMAANDMKELPIVVKADVQGSAEAVKQSLEKISNDEVRVRVIHAGVGAISKSDVSLADASNAIIIGFNVRPDAVAKAEAEQTGVEMRMYRVIYDAINDVSDAMKGMLAPKVREVALGEAQVRQVYKISSVGTVAGCRVTDGKITRDAQLRLVRDGIVICEDSIASLKRFKDDAKEVAEGFECGITLAKFQDIKEGDVFECFKMEEYRD